MPCAPETVVSDRDILFIGLPGPLAGSFRAPRPRETTEEALEFALACYRRGMADGKSLDRTAAQQKFRDATGV